MSQADLSYLHEDRAKKLLQLRAQLKGEPPVTPKIVKKGGKDAAVGENDDPNLLLSGGRPPVTPSLADLETPTLKKFATLLPTPASSRKTLPAGALSAADSPRIQVVHRPRDQPAELWQSRASAAVSSALSKEEKERQEAIFELILTETKYTQLLAEIQQFYVAPLGAVVPPAELRAMFANLAELGPVHEAFVEELRQRRNDGLVVEKLGDVVLRYVQGETLFRRYLEFSSSHSRMEAAIRRAMDGNARLGQHLESMCGGSLPNHLQGNLREDLFKPTARLMKYQVFIKNILDKTPVGHPDHDDLASAHEAAVRLVSEVNEEKRVKEAQDRMAALQALIEWGSSGCGTGAQAFAQQVLAETPRFELHEGSVTIVEVSGNRLKRKKTLRIVVAGGLLLLLGKAKDASDGKQFKLFAPPARLQHVASVDIEDRLEDRQEFKDMFELRVSEPEPLLVVVQATSRKEKAVLMEALGVKDECRIASKKTTSRKHHAAAAVADATGRSTSGSSASSGEVPAAPTSSASASAAAASALRRQPSKRIGELMSKFEQGSSHDLGAELGALKWPLTERQMGVTEREEGAGRFYCLVKSLRGGEWLPIGPGDLVLAKETPTGRTRVIFFQKDDLLKAKINCWLQPLVVAERVASAAKTVVLVIPVKSDQTATYSVQFKTGEEAGSFHSLVNQLKKNGGVREELDEGLLAEIKKQLDSDDVPEIATAAAPDASLRPPLGPHESSKSRKASVTDAAGSLGQEPVGRLSRTSSCLSVRSTASEKSMRQASSADSFAVSEEDGGELMTPVQPQAEGGRSKKTLKRRKSVERREVAALEETMASLDLPEGPVKVLVDLLWQENQMLRALVAKLEKKKSRRSEKKREAGSGAAEEAAL